MADTQDSWQDLLDRMGPKLALPERSLHQLHGVYDDFLERLTAGRGHVERQAILDFAEDWNRVVYEGRAESGEATKVDWSLVLVLLTILQMFLGPKTLEVQTPLQTPTAQVVELTPAQAREIAQAVVEELDKSMGDEQTKP